MGERKMNSILQELAHQVNEACESTQNSKRKELWIAHNNLESKGNVLFNVHLWKMTDHHIWNDLVLDSQIKTTEKLERMVETQLRQSASLKIIKDWIS